MFDAMGVSERTRRPWTVAVSFAGELALVGLAILVPLVTTEGLPHISEWVSVPEPPRALAHHAPRAAKRPEHAIPFQITRLLQMPNEIPPRAQTIQDLAAPPAAGDVVGVEGGIPDAAGPGNGVIDHLVRQLPAAAPLPPPAPARQSAQPIKRVRLGGLVQMGKWLSGPAPVYPALARSARISGIVRLHAVIARDGTILDLRAVSGHPLLVQAALEAVSHWVFSPTYLNGAPVEVETEIEVRFTLQ